MGNDERSMSECLNTRYIFSSFSLYPVYSRVGGGNLGTCAKTGESWWEPCICSPLSAQLSRHCVLSWRRALTGNLLYAEKAWSWFFIYTILNLLIWMSLFFIIFTLDMFFNIKTRYNSQIGIEPDQKFHKPLCYNMK